MTVAANGMTVPSTETSNVLQHLEGPEYVLQVGEGPPNCLIDLYSWLSCKQARMSYATIFSLPPRLLILPRRQL